MKLNHLMAYCNERFPVVNMALFAILFLTVYSVARFFAPLPAHTAFTGTDGWGMMAVISFFFRLRVFDEVKDYDLDCINYPDRVLQSGRVTLRQLTRLSLAGSLIEVSWSIYQGPVTLMAWGLALGYSLLMRYEFFVSSFLKKRLLLYAVSHMLIMPLVIYWVWSAYMPVGAALQALGLLAGLSVLSGFSFELARKLYIPGDERPLVDSYTKTMGYVPAITSVLLVLLAGVGVQFYLLMLLHAPVIPYLLTGGLYGLTLAVYVQAIRRPAAKKLKTAGLLVSLFMLMSYLSVILLVNL
nr:UbiA family prenyltransferase [uncultured Arsenicibacter sp.]